MANLYSAQFLCGQWDRGLLGEAPGPAGPVEGPVKAGNYATTISVHNPNAIDVTFRKKALLLFEGIDPVNRGTAGEGIMEARRWHEPDLTLRADEGVQIDCPDIRTNLLAGTAPFIMGFVVIMVLQPTQAELDVVGVYTGHTFSSQGTPEGFSLNVQQYRPTAQL